MKLGEILIQEGHLNQEGLEEALDWQVLYGGRLGTNLLELKLVDEEHVARALGRQLGVEVIWGPLEAEPEMLGLVPKHVADRNEIVPLKMEKRRLKVASTEPNRVDIVDELSRRTGKVVHLVVAPEFRMFQLLRKHYQATRQMRALDFGVVPVEREALRRKKEKAARGGVEDAPELIDEGAFQQIYAQVLEGRSPAADAKSAVDAVDFGAAVADSIDADDQAVEVAPPPPVRAAPPRPPARAAPPPPRRAPDAQPWPSQWGTSAPQRTPPPFPKAPPRAPPSRAQPTPARPADPARPTSQFAKVPAASPPRVAARPAAPPPAAPVVEQLPDDAILGDAEILEAEPIDDAPAPLEEVPAEAAQAAPEAGPDDTQETPRLQAGDWMQAPVSQAPSAVAWDAPEEPPPAPEEPPLDFKEAVAALAGVSDRDNIARTNLNF